MCAYLLNSEAFAKAYSLLQSNISESLVTATAFALETSKISLLLGGGPFCMW